MTTANEVRRAHDLLDELDARAELSQEQEKLLRSFLPERPKQVTLEQLRVRVHYAWVNVRGNKWLAEDKDLDDFILDLRNDLNLLAEKPKPTSPALPVGMRLAEHKYYGRCVVSPEVNVAGYYEVFYLAPGAASGAYVEELSPGSLTFIDAEPAEPAKPACPEFLETEEDYENAPQRTIVAIGDAAPWMKLGAVWESIVFQGRASGLMGDASRRVLRWGDA